MIKFNKFLEGLTFGRAARNLNGKVILYADSTTPSMAKAIEETTRRQEIQNEFNQQHHIVPQSVRKQIDQGFEALYETAVKDNGVREPHPGYGQGDRPEDEIPVLEAQMKQAVQALEFEKAAELRDRIKSIKEGLVFNG